MTFPSPLDTLSEQEYTVLQQYIEEQVFPAGACIFAESTPGDSCYIIDEGRVRIELDSGTHTDDDNVLTFVESGNILGELALLDRLPRSASAFADTRVVARRISSEAIERLITSHPHIGITILATLGKSASLKLRNATEKLDQYIHSRYDPMVEEMIEKAEAAQREIQTWPEARIDQLIVAIANVINDHAEELARLTVEETKMGNVTDKILKNQIASIGVAQSLIGHKGYGQLSADPRQQVIDVANPVGIVFGLVPMTNPTSTFVFKALICIKSRNAAILSPSAQALNASTRTGELIQQVLREHGAPADLIQWIRVGNSRKTAFAFMRHKKIALILATGGPSMVKAAYSSGNPAIGVGSGNAPVLICPDADLTAAAQNVILSKSFDNGLICASENNLVVVDDIYAQFVAQLEQQGAAVLSPAETEAFLAAAIDSDKHKLKPSIVGQAAAKLAELANVKRDYPIRLLVIPAAKPDDHSALSFEKLAPMTSLFRASDVSNGFTLCKDILDIDGAGHTAIIYTQDDALVQRFGGEMPASRILVNTPGVQGALGVSTGLIPSLTLGCGTFGHNSTTDNVTYTHLMNVKRVAYHVAKPLQDIINSEVLTQTLAASGD